MSLEISLGGMTLGSTTINDGVHKLPKDCYPPTESESEDGEESFVVLNDPESSFIGITEAFKPDPSSNQALSGSSIDRSLNTLNDLAQSVLNQSNLTLRSLNDTLKPQEATVTKNESLLSNSTSIMQQSRCGDSLVQVDGQELNLSFIQSRVQTFSMENAELKEAVKQNNLAMRDQCEKIVVLQEEYKKSTEQAKSKLKDAITLVEYLKTEVEELKFVRDEQNKVINQLQSDITLLNKANADLKTSKETLDKISMANMKSFELQSTEKKLNDTIHNLEEAVERGDMLQAQLNILEHQSESTKFKNIEEIARLKEKLAYFDEKEEHFAEREMEQKTMTNQMTEMQKQIVEMNKRLTDLTTKNGVLEEQLKIYEADFNEEREARQKLKCEEDQLKQDLEFTRKLTEDLKAENARLKTPNGAPMPPTKPSVSDSSPVGVRYECPLCSNKFRSIILLEEHVDTCGTN